MQTIDYDTGEIVGEQALMPISKVTAWLAERPPVEEAQEISARARAACAYYLGKHDVPAYNEAFEIKTRTERYVGARLKEAPDAHGNQYTKVEGNTVLPSTIPTLSDLGISKMQSSRFQQLAEIPDPVFEATIADMKQEPEKVFTKAALFDAAKKTEDHQLINQSISNEWYTPPEYIEAARELMGGIDTDPASNDQANEWIRASTYYTKDRNGFDEPWHGRVWLNPPYGKEEGDSNQQRWTARLIEQYQDGITTEAVCLVNAVPGNLWFAPLWDFPICFVARRIQFYDPTGALGQPTHSNVLVYLPDPNQRDRQFARFVRIFSQFGPVAARLIEDDDQVLIHGIEINNGNDV